MTDQITHTNRRYRVETTADCVAGGMVECDNLDDRLRQSPQAQKMRADAGMARAKDVAFSLPQRDVLVLCRLNGTFVEFRSTCCQNELPNVVQHSCREYLLHCIGTKFLRFRDIAAEPGDFQNRQGLAFK